ncbi:hypothetical protein EBZ80_01940 [bacterium]|nr:hypothetical protein [bacterium]
MTCVAEKLPMDVLRKIIEVGGEYGGITRLSLEIERWRRLYAIFCRERRVILLDEHGAGDEGMLVSDILFFIRHHHVRLCSVNRSLVVYPCLVQE